MFHDYHFTFPLPYVQPPADVNNGALVPEYGAGRPQRLKGSMQKILCGQNRQESKQPPDATLSVPADQTI
jgi:hypothetical protein